MRTDVTIDRKQVHLPNASTLGYGKFKAQHGDVVLFKQDPSIGQLTIGRVVGRIASAPRIGDDPDLRGHLVVVALTQSITSPMERWVDPANVVECFNPQDFGGRDVGEFLRFFFSPEFRNETPDTMRQWANSGCASFATFKGLSR